VYTGRKEIRTEIFFEGNAMGDQFLTSYKFKQNSFQQLVDEYKMLNAKSKIGIMFVFGGKL
jgi:hypothetical protein